MRLSLPDVKQARSDEYVAFPDALSDEHAKSLVSSFLQGIGLSKYFQALLEGGFRSPDEIKSLTYAECERCGLPPHSCKKLLKFAPAFDDVVQKRTVN